MAKNNKKRSTIGIVLRVLLAIFLLLLLLCAVKTCRDCRYPPRTITIVDETGYLPHRDDNIPDVDPPYKDDDLDSLSQGVSLEAFFPPIGNQEKYGTCVAWAAGYNLKTALNAIENHWTTSQLADPANQTSPKDLWLGIAASDKGPQCAGTSFEPAFEVLRTQGASNMKDVPYKNLGTCGGTSPGDSTNRIVSYNRVNFTKVEQIKAYLNDTIPLVVSAHLGDDFMSWNSDQVIKSDTRNKPNMQHAYHAMVISGYDDSKHAFRLRNSWGTRWGDKGSIWVDYDYFINDFCMDVYVASNH